MNLAFNTADPDEPVHAALMVLGILNADQSAKVMAAWRLPRRSARAKTNGHAEPKATNGHTEPRDANGQLTLFDPEVERDRLRKLARPKVSCVSSATFWQNMAPNGSLILPRCTGSRAAAAARPMKLAPFTRERPPDLQGPVAHSNRTTSKPAAQRCMAVDILSGVCRGLRRHTGCAEPLRQRRHRRAPGSGVGWNEKRDAASFVGTVIDGEAVTPVMAAACTDLRGLRLLTALSCDITLIEQRVSLEKLQQPPPPTEMGGTADFIGFSREAIGRYRSSITSTELASLCRQRTTRSSKFMPWPRL